MYPSQENFGIILVVLNLSWGSCVEPFLGLSDPPAWMKHLLSQLPNDSHQHPEFSGITSVEESCLVHLLLRYSIQRLKWG